MNNETEPISMTAYRKPDGTWWVRLTDDQGNVENRGPITWKGDGTFYSHGLNSVASWIPRGYAYRGSGSWQETEDGSYTAVLYKLDSRFS